MRRLKTVRRPPIYPKTPGHLPCSSLTHPLPLSSRRPSVSFGGFGISLNVPWFSGLRVKSVFETEERSRTGDSMQHSILYSMSSRSHRTRAKILDAASRLLLERGYHGVGLEEVAREAGVSRQAIYLHFKSKGDLLVATAQHVDEAVGVLEILRPVREAKTALEALDAGVAAYGAIEPQIYDIANVIYDARRSDEAAEAAWQNRMTFRRENIRHGMERLRREGLLAEGWTVDEAADFAWALLSVHTYEYLVVERGWPIDQFVRRLQTTLRSILVAEPGEGE